MSWLARALVALALVTTLVGALRVAQLERSERDIELPARSLRARMHDPDATHISARLGEVELQAEQRAYFELCSPQGLTPERFEGAFELLILHVERAERMLRVPLDAAHLAHALRDSTGGCLLLGSGLLEHAGHYRVEAVWASAPPSAAALDTPLALHVLAKPNLTRLDLACVVLLGLSLLSLASLGLRNRAADEDPAPQPRSGAGLRARLWAALLAVATVYALSQIPTGSPTFTLVKGLLLLSAQGVLAFGLARRLSTVSATQTLALIGPTRPGIALVAALAAWPMLVATARISLRLVPSTGAAPIQPFIEWPSGMLAAGLLGVLLPAAEELFFRGYLYAALLSLGRAAAAAGSVLLFTALHAEQSWGNWGGLLAVFAAGCVLCALRVVTGSTLPSVLTHLAYNLTLSLISLASAVG